MKAFSHGKFNWYGLIRLFKRGTDIAIKPTLTCNLGCSYCGAEMPGSSCWVNPGTELSMLEWLRLLDSYDKITKIRQICITGGECGLYPTVSILIDCLVAKGYMIYIFTNLVSIAQFKMISPSSRSRVKFKATLHEGVDRAKFAQNLKWMSERFFVINQELDPTWTYGNDLDSMHRKMKFAEDQNRLECDLFGPDGTLYPRDEKSDKAKYDTWRKDRSGMVANPHREKIQGIANVRNN